MLGRMRSTRDVVGGTEPAVSCLPALRRDCRLCAKPSGSPANGGSDQVVTPSSRPLANRRVVAGYTQEGLAEALRVDRTTIGRWERGAQLPQPWQRPDLARLLGVTLERLDVLLRPQSAAHEVA